MRIIRRFIDTLAAHSGSTAKVNRLRSRFDNDVDSGNNAPQPRRARGTMADSEAGSDADEEKNVDEVEAVEAKAPTPEPSAPLARARPRAGEYESPLI